MNKNDEWKMVGMELTTASAHFPVDAAKNPKLDAQYYACRVEVSNGDETHVHVFLIKQSTVTPLKPWRKPLIDKSIALAKKAVSG